SSTRGPLSCRLRWVPTARAARWSVRRSRTISLRSRCSIPAKAVRRAAITQVPGLRRFGRCCSGRSRRRPGNTDLVSTLGPGMSAFLSDGVLNLRPVRRDDLAQLAEWRNAPEIRQRTREWKPLNDADQERWFQRISGPERPDL